MKRETLENKAVRGLTEIAFGSIRDPVRLLFSDELDDESLNIMKLNNISEVKRPKGGGMEIKFFDRIKAIECLFDYMGQTKNDTSFFEALEKSGSAVGMTEDSPDDI